MIQEISEALPKDKGKGLVSKEIKSSNMKCSNCRFIGDVSKSNPSDQTQYPGKRKSDGRQQENASRGIKERQGSYERAAVQEE